MPRCICCDAVTASTMAGSSLCPECKVKFYDPDPPKTHTTNDAADASQERIDAWTGLWNNRRTKAGHKNLDAALDDSLIHPPMDEIEARHSVRLMKAAARVMRARVAAARKKQQGG